MPTLPDILQVSFSIFHFVTTVVYSGSLPVAGVVVLLFDHVLTFGDELLYIWRAPTSFAKCAFLLNRYLVPCVSIPLPIRPFSADHKLDFRF